MVPQANKTNKQTNKQKEAKRTKLLPETLQQITGSIGRALE